MKLRLPIALMLFWGTSASLAEEHPYQIDEPDQPAFADQLAVRNGLRDGTVEDAQRFREVYLWRFSQFTWPDRLATLPKLRNSLKSDLRIAGRAESRAAHQLLNALALEYFAQLALDDQRHAATRVNAMLVVGDLNEQEAIGSEGSPVPLAAALSTLEQALEAPDDPNHGANDAVKCMALVGIVRQATLRDLGAADQQRLAAQAIALATQRETPPARQELAHTWMRRRAMDVLGALARAEARGWALQAAGALRRIAADRQDELAVRADAVAALGRFRRLAPPAPLDAALAKDIGHFAVDLIQHELRGNALGGWEPQSPGSHRVLRRGLSVAWVVLTGKDATEQPKVVSEAPTVPATVTRTVAIWLALVEQYGPDLGEISNDLAVDAQTFDVELSEATQPAEIAGETGE
jgi:hypothetical protein